MKKLLIVDVPDNGQVYQVFYKTPRGITNEFGSMVDFHSSMIVKEVTLPTDEEKEKMVDDIAKESTAPDKDTPNWMKADIRNGINAIINKILNQ